MIRLPNGYWFGKDEVTQAMWETVMGTNPSDFKGADHPVENVSWDDCQAFLQKLNAMPGVKKFRLAFRLPKNDEWEFACRAGATGTFCKLADETEITEETLDSVAWIETNSDKTTHPVGEKRANAFGLHDMHGNVWEWTQTANGEDTRVICGGSWNSGANGVASSHRLAFSHSMRLSNVGFRLCADKR